MSQEKSFWKTAPGTVAGVAAMVTALAGAVPVIIAIRGGNDGPPSSGSPTASASPTEAGASPSPTAGGRADTAPNAGSAAAVIASPKSVDFGKVVPGLSSSTQTVQLLSTGEDPVTLGRVRIIGPASAAFAVTDTTCEEGMDLPPEDTCDVKVRFSPPAAGVQAATLIVERQPGDPLEVPLSGTASLL